MNSEIQQHTPGDWGALPICEESGWVDIRSKDGGRNPIGYATPARNGTPEQRRDTETVANARLIASSPRLLQAAQDAYLQMLSVSDHRIRVTLSYQGALCQLRDSIAAATGRDSQAVQGEYEARATGSQP